MNRSKGRRQTIIAMIGGALMMAVIAPSMVMAGGTPQEVKVVGNTKVVNPTNGTPLIVDPIGTTPVSSNQPLKLRGDGTTNVNVEAETVPDMGLFSSAGAPVTLPVSTFGGGGGFLGAIDCTSTTADGLGSTTTIAGGATGESDQIVTGIISHGTDAQIKIASGALNINLPVVRIRHNATYPYQATALGNGLTLTADLKIDCTAETGTGDGVGGAVIIGQ